MEIPDYRPQQEVQASPIITKPRRVIRTWLLLVLSLGVAAGVSVLTLDILAQPPADFPIGKTIEITPGSGVKTAAALLQTEHVVTSKYLLYAVIWWHHDPTALKASVYSFTEPLSVYEVADKLMQGDFTSNLIKFTHREGERASEIATTATQLLTDFDSVTFMQLAEPQEGKLYPDTYLVPPDFTATELFTSMQEAYEQNIAPLRADIAAGTLTENDVIILASIIEREANSPESMNMVSGILQNRLRIKMALQVDASIEYILNKPLKDLTAADLEIDSPYNTYSHNELPPTPIGNPGLTAIKSVLKPTPSNYLYYITDSAGQFHYAETFEEHKSNVARYLR